MGCATSLRSGNDNYGAKRGWKRPEQREGVGSAGARGVLRAKSSSISLPAAGTGLDTGAEGQGMRPKCGELARKLR